MCGLGVLSFAVFPFILFSSHRAAVRANFFAEHFEFGFNANATATRPGTNQLRCRLLEHPVAIAVGGIADRDHHDLWFFVRVRLDQFCLECFPNR